MNTQPTPETDSAYIQRPNEGAWDFRVRQEKTMEKLERERDEARFDLNFRRRLGDLQNKTIDDLTKQRDEAREELTDMIEQRNYFLRQRDRLAEALRYVLDDTAPYVRQWTIEKANKALQSLTPNDTAHTPTDL